MKIGKQREFEAALQRLRGVDADISQEASDIKVTYHWKFFWTHYYHIIDINTVNWASCLSCIVQDYTDNLQQNSDDKIQNLFQRKYVHLLIVCWKNESYPVLLPFVL